MCVSIRVGLCQGVQGFAGSPPAGHEFASNWTQSIQLVLFQSAGKINVLFLCFEALSLGTLKIKKQCLPSQPDKKKKKIPAVLARRPELTKHIFFKYSLSLNYIAQLYCGISED